MHRREFLKLVGSAVACSGIAANVLAKSGEATDSVPGSQASMPRLRDEAAARGLHFGATAEVRIADQPVEYGQLFREHCDLFAPGFTSWYWVAPTPDEYDFSREGTNIKFAADSGLSLTGSHLLWHMRTPKWVNSLNRAEAEKAIRRHIAEMTTRFRHQYFSWNAVNEAIFPQDGRPDGLRNPESDPFIKLFGPEYIDMAFHLARECAPDAWLVYNDCRFELDSQAPCRKALLELIDRLLVNRVPIDAVGIQGHLYATDKFDAKVYRSFLREISQRGLKIFITELDVWGKGLPGDIAVRDQAIADKYALYLDTVLDEPQVASVVTWGLSDRYTHLAPTSFVYKPEFARADGLPNRPLPFDVQFHPKPAFRAIVNSLRHAPVRPMLPIRRQISAR